MHFGVEGRSHVGMMESPTGKPYPSDVGDDELGFVAPHLTLMREDAPQREHPRRELFNGLRWIVRTGGEWLGLKGRSSHDLPPWCKVYQ